MTHRINKPDTSADDELKKHLNGKTCFIMVAGAGSGKTTSLIKALAYLERTQGDFLRKRGQKIACITYTTGAEYEIKNDVGHDRLFYISTIHGFLWEFIKPFQIEIKRWVGQQIQEKLNKLIEEKKNFNRRHRVTTIERNQSETTKYLEIQDKIAKVSQFKYHIGSNYLEGILGHDDIINLGPDLIKEYPLLRKIFAQKYPFLFIDESQDTIPAVAKALKLIAAPANHTFCLGFFGDEMQKIYQTGIGKIEPEPGWEKVTKPENFRCSMSVLNVINKLRKPVDGLEQTGGLTKIINGIQQSIQGTARLFLFPSNVDRTKVLEQIRQYQEEVNKDPGWYTQEADLKILVLEHRMAAKRLGFPDLYAAFKDNIPKSLSGLSEDFTVGKSWALRPFQDYLIPLVEALRTNHSFEMLNLLRQYCPLMKKEYLKTSTCPTTLFQSLKNNIQSLSDLMNDTSTVTVFDILQFVTENDLIKLDDRILRLMRHDIPVTLSIDSAEASDDLKKVMRAYFNCPVMQLWGYQIYVNHQSPFATQHSIKGAEFERVLVVLDDEDKKGSTQYSYEKFLGVKPPSETDNQNLMDGKETVFDRTRRLFYVCCSRAVKDLAVVFFVSNVETAVKQIKAANIFEENDIISFYN